MRLWIGIGCLLAAGMAAYGQESAQPKAEKPAAGLLDDVLAQWERRGTSETLDASFTRVDQSSEWATDVHYEGRILLKKPCYAFVNLEKITGRDRVTAERIVWDGKKLYQYRGETRQIFVYPLPTGQERLGPPSSRGSGFLARMFVTLIPMFNSLHGDHLPILVDMDVADAKRFYRMGLEQDLPESAQISLIPLTADGQKDRMGEIALLRLDKATYTPTEVTLRSADGKYTSEYRFTRISRNVALNEQNFQYKPLRGWQEIPYPEVGALQPGDDSPTKTKVR